MIRPYTFIDHTADFGIHVTGENPQALFTHAAMALLDVLTDRQCLIGEREVLLRIAGADWPDLMVDWLRELLYLFNGEKKLVQGVDIRRIGPDGISAALRCDDYDPARHPVHQEIKAVTYHQIAVRQTPDGWEARIIFDI